MIMTLKVHLTQHVCRLHRPSLVKLIYNKLVNFIAASKTEDYFNDLLPFSQFSESPCIYRVPLNCDFRDNYTEFLMSPSFCSRFHANINFFPSLQNNYLNRIRTRKKTFNFESSYFNSFKSSLQSNSLWVIQGARNRREI